MTSYDVGSFMTTLLAKDYPINRTYEALHKSKIPKDTKSKASRYAIKISNFFI